MTTTIENTSERRKEDRLKNMSDKVLENRIEVYTNDLTELRAEQIRRTSKSGLILKCPVCKVSLPYNGYPANPNVSTIMCMSCGYTGPGYAFHRICNTCRNEYDVNDVTIEEKNGVKSVTCNSCKKDTSEQPEQK